MLLVIVWIIESVKYSNMLNYIIPTPPITGRKFVKLDYNIVVICIFIGTTDNLYTLSILIAQLFVCDDWPLIVFSLCISYLLTGHVGPCTLKITYSGHSDLSVKFQSHRSRYCWFLWLLRHTGNLCSSIYLFPGDFLLIHYHGQWPLVLHLTLHIVLLALLFTWQ